MTNRYTDNVSGLDGNDGLTLLTPKQNMHAHTGANGDTMFVKGTGTMYDRSGSSFVLDWTTLSGVTIRDWPGFPRPVITHTNGPGFGRAIGVGAGGSAMNTVQNLIIQDTTDGGIGSIGANGAQLTVQNCKLYRCGLTRDSATLGAGIAIGGTNSIATLIVNGSIVVDCGRPNIFANVTGTYEVAYCDLRNPGLASPGTNTGDCVESGIAPTVYWVHHNRMSHPKNAKQCIQQSGGTTGQATFEFNELIGPVGSGNSYKAIFCEMPAIVRCNRILTGGFALNLKGTAIVNSNYIEVNGPGWGSNQGPILIENDMATTADVDHNTIRLLADGSGFYSGISAYFDATKGTGRIRNNLVIGAWTAGIRRHSTAWSESNNAVFGAGIAVADQNLVALTSGAITRNPQMGNGKPLRSSALVGAGTPISGYLDLDGKPFSRNPTIGAIEVDRVGSGFKPWKVVFRDERRVS